MIRILNVSLLLVIACLQLVWTLPQPSKRNEIIQIPVSVVPTNKKDITPLGNDGSTFRINSLHQDRQGHHRNARYRRGGLKKFGKRLRKSFKKRTRKLEKSIKKRGKEIENAGKAAIAPAVIAAIAA